MTQSIEKIRKVVELVSSFTEEDWGNVEKLISANVTSESTTKSKELKEISYEEKVIKISEILKKVGIPVSIKGYHYMREGIIWLIDNYESYNLGITKSLYPDIAAKFKTTSSRVERAIRHAIEVAWERGDSKTHNMIFGNTISTKSGKPTNSEAISGLADYVRMNML